MADDSTRSRTVSWEDPAASARRGLDLTGLEYIQEIVRGDVPAPPMARLMGFRLVEAEEGRALFECLPGEHHYNPMNTVHGGLPLTILDSAMGVTVHTTLARGQFYATLEAKVNMVGPISADTGLIRAEGTLVHRGSKTATAEGHLRVAESGKLLAHGTCTCMILGD